MDESVDVAAGRDEFRDGANRSVLNIVKCAVGRLWVHDADEIDEDVGWRLILLFGISSFVGGGVG